MSIFQLALTFFIVTNPIGNTPTALALVKNYDFNTQRRILIREGFFSFLVAIFFQFFGEMFLSLLGVKDYAMTLCGGTLLFIISLHMIFPPQEIETDRKTAQEPFIVPIATPLLSGPGVLTLIMLFSKQEANVLKISTAILIAWTGVVLVMGAAPYLQRALGRRGLLALEQLFGMLLGVIAVSMLVKGVRLFMNVISTG